MGELVPGKRLSTSVSLSDLKKRFQADLDNTKVVNPSTKAARLEAYKGSGEALTYEQVRDMRVEVQRFASILGFVDIVDPRSLANWELEELMHEFKALEASDLIAKARRERIKQMVFTHIDVKNGPDSQGEVVVGEKRFKKEGGGNAEPTFNLAELKKRFKGEYAQFFKTTLVTTEELDQDALEAFLVANPDRMEDVRASLVPGKAKPFRFAVRDVKDDSEE